MHIILLRDWYNQAVYYMTNGYIHSAHLIQVQRFYLTALDLFKQYETDPEKALYHLLQIPRLEGTEPKKDLEKINVTFFEDGYKNLENQCKKLLKTRTTSYKK